MHRNPLCPTDLGIILSYRCQNACKHCLHNCGPSWQNWISPETLEEALQATRAWGHRFQIHLTGGEPFLNFSLLLEGVQLAAQLGIPCYVETNAGWCLKKEDVVEKFAILKETGLNAILISCSPFHAENPPCTNPAGHHQGVGNIWSAECHRLSAPLDRADSDFRCREAHSPGTVRGKVRIGKGGQDALGWLQHHPGGSVWISPGTSDPEEPCFGLQR